ncbi:MAG TPA: hypothetical protein VF658_04335 [Pyrinomonadaceae bacterium]|jgi:hypothetical protein
MVRSILAVIAGSVTWMVTALGMDTILMSLTPHWFGPNGKVESVPLMLFMMSYSLLFSALGGYVAALIARRKEILHAFVLGVIQLLMGIVATIYFFDTAPLWWHLTFLALLIPANVFGGWLRLNQKDKLIGNSAATA